MAQRRGVTNKLGKEYRGADKKKKGEILDTLVKLNGYNRCYAGWLMRLWGRKYLVEIEGQLVELRVGRVKKRKEVNRRRYYDEPVMRVLKTIWESFDYMCGQRLAAMIKETLPVLVGTGELCCSRGTYEKLLKISGATIDRLLREPKAKVRIRGRSHTKPTSVLKAEIPIRTWSEVEVSEPGHFQIDLVGHDGGSSCGEFAYSLDCIDLYSGWVEPRALKNRAHSWTLEAMKDVRIQSPIPLKSIHSDNGGEFINTQLYQWCDDNHIEFYRSRAYRKNDTCYVEQKNFNIIRQAVGYARFCTEQEVTLIGELYDHLRLLVNHFYPSAKLIEKRRVGSRVYKRHDKPKSPYRRLLDCEGFDKQIKAQLKEQHRKLRPMRLKQRISQLQDRLYKMVREKSGPRNGPILQGIDPPQEEFEVEQYV